MAEVYIYTILSVIIVSLISLVGIFTLALNDKLLRRYTFLLVSLAIGALLGDAFIHLIPEANAALGSTNAALLVIAGILIFFVLEKTLHWHHHHGSEEEYIAQEETQTKRIHPVGYMVLVSDGVHNFLDGVIIGASFLVSIEVGIATTIAVIIHEIPQEIGDFGVLIHSGFSKARALVFNFFSALLAVVGAVAVLLLHTIAEPITALLVPIAAGSFIYIATSDLIPELHKVKNVKHSIAQFLVILIGVGAMLAITYTEAEEGHTHGDETAHSEEIHTGEESHADEEHAHE